MTYTEDQLWDLVQQAYEMPYGAAQIALVEQVIAHADALHLTKLCYDARMLGTTAYVYGGEPAKAFVTFSWCLAEFDRDPVAYRHGVHALLWHFKYMISGLTRFPEVPLERTRAVLDDMERRWQEGGHSPHAVYAHRHFLARHIGDLAEAEEWYRKWITSPRDDLSDCVGCDPTSKASWLTLQRRDEEAVAIAEGVLAGRLTCSEQPQGMLTTLLRPYLRTGRLEQARDAHRRAYRLHRPHLADLADIASHIEFCAITGNAARGVEILERHLGWLDRAPSPHAEMWFAAAGALVLRRAIERGHEPVRLHRPAHGDRAAADVEAPALADELTTLALGIAARFDARNGTEYQSGLVRARLAEEPVVDHLSLSPTAPPHLAATSPHGPAPGSQPTTAPGLPSPSPTPAHTPAPMPGPAPASAAPPVPETAGPDGLLDLAEEHLKRGRRAEAFAAWHAFDDRYAGWDLTVLQRGRRADGHGVEAAYRDELVEAETAWRSAVDLFADAGDEVRRQTTRSRVGRAMCATGRGEPGLAMVEEAASYLLAHGDPERWTGALAAVATAQMHVGRGEEALSTLERAEEYVDRCPDPQALAHLRGQRAQCLGALGRFEESRAAAEETVRLARAGDFAEGVANASFLVGLAAEQLDDQEAAVAAYDESLAVATEEDLIRRVRLQRAGILASSPRAVEVVDDLVESVAWLTGLGETQPAMRVRHALAIAYLNAGRALDSAEVAEEVVAFYVAQAADDDEYHDQVLAVRHLLAAAYRQLDQPHEAIGQLELISARCAGQANPAGVGQMEEEIGDILDRLDRDAAAATRYLAAAEAYRQADLKVEEARNRRQHATSLLWSGDTAGALAALEKADEMGLWLPSSPAPTGDAATWERAMTLYDGAKILRNADRLGEAALRAGNAAATFRLMGAMDQAAFAEMLHADLLLRADRAGEAEAAARRGLAELSDVPDARERLTELLNAAIEAQRGAPEA